MPASANQPKTPADDFSSVQWFDRQNVADNILDPDWQKNFNAASFGSAGAGYQPDNGLMLAQGMKPPTQADGQWVLKGVTPGSPGGEGGSTPGVNSYTFIPNAAAPVAAQPAPQERAPDAAPDPNRPTIYDSFDDYIDIARGEDQGRNRMPFVFGGGYGEGQPTYQDVPYDPILALEQVYPSGRNSFRTDLSDPLKGEQLVPYNGQGGTGMPGSTTGMQTGSRNKTPVDPTKRSGYYENYGDPAFVGVPDGGYGGVRAPAPFNSTYPGMGTGYAAYRPR